MTVQTSNNHAPFGLFVDFVRSIALLALPASAQQDFIEAQHLEPSIDELALQFSDEVALVPTFIAHGWMTERQAEIVHAVQDHFDIASGKNEADFWLLPALHCAAWSDIRSQAQLFFTERKAPLLPEIETGVPGGTGPPVA